MEFQSLLQELKKLNLSEGEYTIFGSGPMAIREIRESEDLDILVTNKLFQELLQKFPQDISKHLYKAIVVGNIEIGNNWQGNKEIVNSLIKKSETIKGFPFVPLEEVINFKKKLNRDKDKKDLELINKYLENNKS